MTQDGELDRLVRKRIRSLRTARGWSLDELAARCFLSPSTLSRMETGQRRIGLDQLAAIARALGSTIDQLVEPVGDDDVVIRPQRDDDRGVTTWLLTREPNPTDKTVGKLRITRTAPPPGEDVLRVHPGRDWLTVLSGTLVLLLGDRKILVQAGEAAEFSTMVPHYFYAHESGPVEIIAILDHEGRRHHLHAHDH